MNGWTFATVLLILVTLFGLYVLRSRKQRSIVHRVIVQFSRGNRIKLVLSDTQHEQFLAWMNSPDGIYEIGDETQKVWLERTCVSSVQSKKTAKVVW